MEGDTPIKRKTFLEMNEVEQEAFISELRDRRLSPINTYNEVREAARLAKEEKLKKKLNKELEMFDKCLVRCDKYLNELSDRANKLRMYKIQLELE